MPKEINAIIITGSAVVDTIKLATENTFAEYQKYQENQDSPFCPTFNLSSPVQSILMSYGMNIMQTV